MQVSCNSQYQPNPAMCTVAWEVLGREGEQTLHGDRDLLFCRLNCGTERDGQPFGRLPFIETLQRNKQAFLSWTENLYISRVQQRGDERRADSRLREGRAFGVDRIAWSEIYFGFWIQQNQCSIYCQQSYVTWWMFPCPVKTFFIATKLYRKHVNSN